MTTPIDKDLRALAEAATDGVWKTAESLGPNRLILVGPASMGTSKGGEDEGALFSPHDAQFIAAANPQTVIGLLDRIEAAEATIGFWAGQASYDESAVNREVELSKKKAELSATRSQLEALTEALTASGETKAAYIGEFWWSTDDFARIEVPWTVTKDIMKAILRRAKAGGTDA
jgi:hypothetical protein